MKLNDYQRGNWNKVLTFMENSPNLNYRHESYNTDITDTNPHTRGGDITSFLFISNFFSLATAPKRFYTVASNFTGVIERDFGEGFFKEFPGTDSPFAKWFRNVKKATFSSCHPPYVAKCIREWLELENVIPVTAEVVKVVLHYKSGQKDNFEDLNALKKHLEWNPHRRNSISKITEIKKVPVVTYEEVESTIDHSNL